MQNGSMFADLRDKSIQGVKDCEFASGNSSSRGVFAEIVLQDLTVKGDKDIDFPGIVFYGGAAFYVMNGQASI